MPRPQVRSDHAARVLPAFRLLQQHRRERSRGRGRSFIAVPTAEQAAQAEKLIAAIAESRARLAAANTVEESAELARLQKEQTRLEAAYVKAMILQEMPEQRPTWVLQRGAYDKHGEAVVADVPAALPGLAAYPPANRLDMRVG